LGDRKDIGPVKTTCATHLQLFLPELLEEENQEGTGETRLTWKTIVTIEAGM